MSILVSGSLVHDYIMDFNGKFKDHIMPDKIHILNVCFMVDQLNRSWGGTAGNIAYSLALLGSDPIIVSAVGKDGNDYLTHFRENKIKTDYIKVDDSQMTASAHITTDQDDNQITAFFGGPLNLADDITGSGIELALISPTDKKIMQNHLRQCADLGIKVIFDPGQQIFGFNGEEMKEMISGSYFLIGNDYEMNLIRERTLWDNSEILKHVEIMITTLGDRGSLIETRDGRKIEVPPAKPLSTIDPTGAGDAYRAGFFRGFELGYELEKCGKMGAVMACYAIETRGTQDFKFSHEDFIKRYRENFGEKVDLK